MRVLLVSYSGRPLHPDNFMPDNGLALLAAVLREAGHEPRILDLNTPKLLGEWKRHEDVEAQLLSAVRSFSPDVVAFKLFINGFFDSVRLAEAVRSRDASIRLIAGGPQVSYFEEKIFGITGVFDALVTGEGERAITALMDAFEGKRAFSQVPNLIHRRKGKTIKAKRLFTGHLGTLPEPAWDLYEGAMKQVWPIFVFSLTRGCAMGCSFCVHPHIWGSSFRSRPADAAVAEIRSARERYGVTHFRLADSSPVPAALTAFSKQLAAERLGVRWSAFAHSKMMDAGTAQLMREAGCILLWYGLESANGAILTRMNKKMCSGDVMRAAQATRSAGMKVLTSLVVGFPGEDEGTLEETFQFVRSLRPDSVQVTALGVLPNTPLARQAGDYGIALADDWEGSLMRMTFSSMSARSTSGSGYFHSSGKPWEHWVQKGAELVGRLEQEGIVTQATDDLFLMADLLGEDIAPFRSEMEECFRLGQQWRIERAIRRAWKE